MLEEEKSKESKGLRWAGGQCKKAGGKKRDQSVPKTEEQSEEGSFRKGAEVSGSHAKRFRNMELTDAESWPPLALGRGEETNLLGEGSHVWLQGQAGPSQGPCRPGARRENALTSLPPSFC